MLLAGATGLVGGACLRLLAQDDTVAQVRALVRRPLPDAGAYRARVVQCMADFEALDRHPEWFRCDQVICALGTTMRTAGSSVAFRRVDYDYPLTIAKLALTQGASHFLLVSSMGADLQSANFYYRVKGELEEALRALGYASLTIARPSLLLGKRAEWRWGEELGRRMGRLLPGCWRPVSAVQVAAALIAAAGSSEVGVRLLENAAIRKMALPA